MVAMLPSGPDLWRCFAALVILMFLGAAAVDAGEQPALKIVSVDVEGGAALLFATPEGKSLLIDTGWPPGAGGPRAIPGAPPRAAGASSAEKIAMAATSLGIKKIDYLLLTHYHVDHLGGLEALLAKLPVVTFIDHGPNRQPANPGAAPSPFSTASLYAKYETLAKGHRHITAQAGQTLDIGSLHLTFVTSDGALPDAPLPGAGQANPLCEGVPDMARDGGEDSRSVGTLITFGKTRILELGDLPWNNEKALLCPVNKVGPVDVYIVTQHGSNFSSSPPTAALDPIVAVMGNGATKGGDVDPINTVSHYPHLEGLWREHVAVLHPETNGDPSYIANLDWVPDQNYTINLSITFDGLITVANSRNRFTKTYRAREAR